jgi:N-acetylmuramoyl-L-alanine amidase
MRPFAAIALLGLIGTARAARTTLERVDIAASGPTAVHVRLNLPVHPVARVLPRQGDTPPRIYVDFPGAALEGTPTTIVGAGNLLRVRTGQFDRTTARVVLDLAELTRFGVREDGATVTIELAAVAPPAPVAAPSPPRAPPPPPPAPPPVAQERSIIVVDAGHGGHDPGAAGVGGVIEKDLVLELARRLAERLTERLPVTVIMTRTDDSFVPLDQRLAVSTEGAALFLSLHANACQDPGTGGLEVFYGGGTLQPASTRATSRKAALLAHLLSQALRARIGHVRGEPRPAGFSVLVHNPAPSALIEVGYLTHPRDVARAQDARYQEVLTEALVDGVAAFLRASTARL